MTNSDTIKDVICSFSGSQRIITFPEIYAKITGDVNTALFMNQVIFWSDKTKRKDGYFYKTYQEWEKEVFLTKHQITRCISKLEKLGVLETKVMKADGSPTKHYKVNMDQVQQLLIEQTQKENPPKPASLLESQKTGNGKLKKRKWKVKKTEIFNNIRIQHKNTTDDNCRQQPQQKTSFVTMWEKAGFGMISPFNIENLVQWIQTFNGQEEIIIKAIEVAAANNPKAPARYIDGILKSWEQKGIRTLADIEAEEKKHEKEKTPQFQNDQDAEYYKVNGTLNW